MRNASGTPRELCNDDGFPNVFWTGGLYACLQRRTISVSGHGGLVMHADPGLALCLGKDMECKNVKAQSMFLDIDMIDIVGYGWVKQHAGSFIYDSHACRKAYRLHSHLVDLTSAWIYCSRRMHANRILPGQPMSGQVSKHAEWIRCATHLPAMHDSGCKLDPVASDRVGKPSHKATQSMFRPGHS